jgi:TPR repeat protein
MKTRRSFIVVMLLFTSATFLWAEDQAASFDSLKTRATQGDVVAQNSLGGMYRMGKGVPQDYAEALKWFRLSAAQGQVDA